MEQVSKCLLFGIPVNMAIFASATLTPPLESEYWSTLDHTLPSFSTGWRLLSSCPWFWISAYFWYSLHKRICLCCRLQYFPGECSSKGMVLFLSSPSSTDFFYHLNKYNWISFFNRKKWIIHLFPPLNVNGEESTFVFFIYLLNFLYLVLLFRTIWM